MQARAYVGEKSDFGSLLDYGQALGEDVEEKVRLHRLVAPARSPELAAKDAIGACSSELEEELSSEEDWLLLCSELDEEEAEEVWTEESEENCEEDSPSGDCSVPLGEE